MQDHSIALLIGPTYPSVPTMVVWQMESTGFRVEGTGKQIHGAGATQATQSYSPQRA